MSTPSVAFFALVLHVTVSLLTAVGACRYATSAPSTQLSSDGGIITPGTTQLGEAVLAPAPLKALAVPAVAANVQAQNEPTVVRAAPSHFLLAAHSFTLATIQVLSSVSHAVSLRSVSRLTRRCWRDQGVLKGDLSDFKKDALCNAETMTPVGAHFMREHISEPARAPRVFHY